MVLTDGTTTVTLVNSDETLDPIIDKSTKQSVGGDLKSITAGERARFEVRVRGTPAQVRELLDLLKNNADAYWFTPRETFTDLYPDIDFPLKCNVTNFTRDWDNRSYYYISFVVESVSYV